MDEEMDLLEANERFGEAFVEIALAVGLRPGPFPWCSKTAILEAIAERGKPTTAERLMGPQVRRIGLLSVTLRRLVEAIDRDEGEDLTPLWEQAKEVLADNMANDMMRQQEEALDSWSRDD